MFTTEELSEHFNCEENTRKSQYFPLNCVVKIERRIFEMHDAYYVYPPATIPVQIESIASFGKILSMTHLLWPSGDNESLHSTRQQKTM